MTDTARTLADIQTLFADNTSGAISPQDLRDFVQSVAVPVEGGGFDRDIGKSSLGAIDDAMVPVADNVFTPYKVWDGADPSANHVYDELGIRQTGSNYVSTFDGLTREAGSWWSLPAGVYLAKIQVVWSTSSSAGQRLVNVAPIDNRADTNDLDHLYWAPGYQGGIAMSSMEVATGATVNGFGGAGGMQVASYVYRVLPDVAPAAFGAMIYQNSGSALSLTSGNVIFMKIG